VFQFFETEQIPGVAAALPDDVRCGSVMGDAVYPGSQRALLIRARETAPEREVNFLTQVAAFIRIEFISPRQPVEGRTISGGCFLVQLILPHNQIVARQGPFLHPTRTLFGEC